MKLWRIAVGLGLVMAPSTTTEAKEAPRVVVEALTLKSGKKTYDVAVYRPNDRAKHPAIVYLHGGGSSFEDPVMASFHTELAKRGLVVLAPHYLLDGTGWPHWHQTATDTVTLATTLPGVDPDRIGMAGLSMGGQIGLSTADRDPRIKAVAEFFTAWPGTMPDEPIAALPKVLLINGTDDPIIPLDKAFQLDGILRERRMPFERKLYHGLGHGFGTGEAFEDGVLRTARFFGGDVDEPGPEAVATAPIPDESGPAVVTPGPDADDVALAEAYAWAYWSQFEVVAPKKKAKKRRPTAPTADAARKAEKPPTVATP